MRLLLDTHVLLWWLADDPSLSRSARDAIADSTTDVIVSAASVWEIAIKRALGKLEAPDDLLDAMKASDFDSLPITADHALAAGALPPHHTDPFDRMIVAQAQSEALVLVSTDPRLAAYDVALFAPG